MSSLFIIFGTKYSQTSQTDTILHVLSNYDLIWNCISMCGSARYIIMSLYCLHMLIT